MTHGTHVALALRRKALILNYVDGDNSYKL